MRKSALKVTMPPELHTWDQVIAARTRNQIATVLFDLFRNGVIRGFCVRSLYDMSRGENNPRMHVVNDLNDILSGLEREAGYLDRFHHYQILVHEAPRVPDTAVETNARHPRLATVVCEEPGETLPLTE